MPSNITGIGGIKVGDQRLPSGTKPELGSPAQTLAGAPDESVKLSGEARNIIQIESKLKDIPEIDQARVERIRSAVAKGEYHVDPRRVALRFLEVEGHLATSS